MDQLVEPTGNSVFMQYKVDWNLSKLSIANVHNGNNNVTFNNTNYCANTYNIKLYGKTSWGS